jgi:hypothetical protein
MTWALAGVPMSVAPEILSKSWIWVESLVFKLQLVYILRLIESFDISFEDVIIFQYFMLSIFQGDFGK